MTMPNFKERLKELNTKLMGKGTFTERMNALEDSLLRKWVISDLSEMTDTATWSVAYSWAKGLSIPPICKQRIIASYFNTSISELFPQSE